VVLKSTRGAIEFIEFLVDAGRLTVEEGEEHRARYKDLFRRSDIDEILHPVPTAGLAHLSRRFQLEVLSEEAFQSRLHIHRAAFEQEAGAHTTAPSADAGQSTAGPTVHHAAADVHQQDPTPLPRLPDDQQWAAVLPRLKLGNNLTPDQKERVLGVLAKHPHAFSRDASDLGLVKGVYHRIYMGDHGPTRRPGRRLSPFEEGEISSQMAPMEELNVIRPSTSAFAAPIVLARKKSDAWRGLQSSERSHFAQLLSHTSH
jgi:hypothetical protein